MTFLIKGVFLLNVRCAQYYEAMIITCVCNMGPCSGSVEVICVSPVCSL